MGGATADRVLKLDRSLETTTMLVDVFIARNALSPNRPLLLLTSIEAARKIVAKQWRFYGTLDSQSTLFDGVAVELHLQARGFAVVQPRDCSSGGSVVATTRSKSHSPVAIRLSADRSWPDTVLAGCTSLPKVVA
jgi:hypothetical protein